MKLAIYQCNDSTCAARFHGKAGVLNEHCGIEASLVTDDDKRCEAIQVVQIGTQRDIRRGTISRHVERGFWRTSPGTLVAESILEERFTGKRDDVPVVHAHRCTETENHTGDHRCTCEYQWS